MRHALLAQIGIILLLSLYVSIGASLPQEDVGKIADAIYRIEGGEKTKYPYGISIIKTRNKEHARQICVNTINNNFTRWQKQSDVNNYFDFLATKYCPYNTRVWRRNMEKVLGQAFVNKYTLDKYPKLK